MDYTEQMRLFTLNAFLFISSLFTLLFVVVFTSLGSYSALQGLFVIPVLLLIIRLNELGRFKLARFLVIYALLALILALALLDRRTGTEYILIALGCCSVVVFERLAGIIAAFVSSFACYAFYVWYDATYPFVADPHTPYILIQNSLMFLSGFGVVAQSLAFRSLVNKYARSLKAANKEVRSINKELKSSNEELVGLAEQLEWIVKQKSTELQSYQDAININIYSALTNLNGDILKINNPLAIISGYTSEELIGQNFRMLNSGHHSQQFFQNLHDTIRTGKSWRGEVKNKAKNGTTFWIDMVIMPIKNEKDSTIYFLTLALPITDRKEAQEKQEDTAKMLENIAFRTSHKVRGPLARIMGLTSLLEKDVIDKTEVDYVSKRLIESSNELDLATHDLTEFVNKYQGDFLNTEKPNEKLTSTN